MLRTLSEANGTKHLWCVSDAVCHVHSAGRSPSLSNQRSFAVCAAQDELAAKLKPGDVVRFGADPACSHVLRDR